MLNTKLSLKIRPSDPDGTYSADSREGISASHFLEALCHGRHCRENIQVTRGLLKSLRKGVTKSGIIKMFSVVKNYSAI